LDTSVLEKKAFIKVIDELKSKSKQRKFDEAVELIYTLKNINVKNRDQRIELSVNLPHPYLEKVSSLVFVKDKNLASELKGVVDKIILDEEIPKISKKEAKKLAEEHKVFLAEGPVMLTVGKHLGQVLSPRGKMPLIAPPNINAIKSIINSTVSQQKISNKKSKTSVAIQTKVGKRSQSSLDLAENCVVITRAIIDKLPVGEQNLKSVYIKSTMSGTINLEAVGGKK
jgi:large subunit ribosomal protein L1